MKRGRYTHNRNKPIRNSERVKEKWYQGQSTSLKFISCNKRTNLLFMSNFNGRKYKDFIACKTTVNMTVRNVCLYVYLYGVKMVRKWIREMNIKKT